MSTGERRSYAEAQAIAQRLYDVLEPACVRITIAGSLRRKAPDIGDIELVLIPRLEPVVDPMFGLPTGKMRSAVDAKLTERGVSWPTKGERSRRFWWEGMQADLFVQPDPRTFGLNLFLRTGSAAFSHGALGRLNRLGMRCEGARVWRGNEVLSTPEESCIFDLLEMDFVPPEERTKTFWEDHRELFRVRRAAS